MWIFWIFYYLKKSQNIYCRPKTFSQSFIYFSWIIVCGFNLVQSQVILDRTLLRSTYPSFSSATKISFTGKSISHIDHNAFTAVNSVQIECASEFSAREFLAEQYDSSYKSGIQYILLLFGFYIHFGVHCKLL